MSAYMLMRDRMMLSIAPVWDFNETWLILGGAGLFAVFHFAYAIMMPALHGPILVMLIALIFRGVAFAFRPVPVVTGLVAFLLWRAVERNARYRPFFLSVALFLLGYLGLAISLFPHIVPPGVTIWEAASTPSSQLFTLVGFAFALTATLAYTGHAYWVFQRKVAEDVEAGGHH